MKLSIITLIALMMLGLCVTSLADDPNEPEPEIILLTEDPNEPEPEFIISMIELTEDPNEPEPEMF